MRKLASIQIISDVQPIEGADRIEQISVEGWKCVANKGQFKKGDLCVYFEIDSFLPIRPEFEFLRASSYKKTDFMGEGFRLKTKKFRGVLSQGLALPLSVFKDLPSEADIAVGMDVTEWLGVKKWEIEEFTSTGGNVIGTLPYDVPRTDETRIQAEPELLQAFAGLEYYISTKLDGSSHSISVDENGFHVTGHNYEYKNDDSSGFYALVNKKGYQAIVERFYKEKSLKTLTIQGEFCGPGIQKNPLRLKEPEWFVFTIRINGHRVGLETMTTLCTIFGMPMVPIEEVDKDLPSKYQTVEALLARADGNYETGGRKEGIVIRTTEPIYNTTIGGPLSIKVVSNKYLLKNE